jgi:hypothetical protein
MLDVAVYSAEVWLALGTLCAPIQLKVLPSTRTNPVQPSTCPLQSVSHVREVHARYLRPKRRPLSGQITPILIIPSRQPHAQIRILDSKRDRRRARGRKRRIDLGGDRGEQRAQRT